MQEENNIKDINAAKEAFIQALEAGGELPAEEPPIEGGGELVPPEAVEGAGEPPAAIEGEAAVVEGVPTATEEPAEDGEDAQVALLQEIRDQLVRQGESPITEPQEPQKTVEPEPDPLESINAEDFMEQMADDPKGTLKALIDTVKSQTAQDILAKIEPAIRLAQNVQDRDEATATLEQFFKENEDANNHLDGIREYLSGSQLPLNDPRSLKEAYMATKLKSMEGMKPFEDYLKDDASVEKMLSDDGMLEKIFANPVFAEKARSHEGVRGNVIADYLSEIEQGKKPHTLTDGGGVAPATPPAAAPRTVDDAVKAMQRDFGRK